MALFHKDIFSLLFGNDTMLHECLAISTLNYLLLLYSSSSTVCHAEVQNGNNNVDATDEEGHPIGKIVGGYFGKAAASLKDLVGGSGDGGESGGTTASVWIRKLHYVIDTVTNETMDAVDPPKGEKSIGEHMQQVFSEAKDAAVNAVAPSNVNATVGDRASGVFDFFSRNIKKMVSEDRIEKVTKFFKGLFD